jgi:hypothetical protein
LDILVAAGAEELLTCQTGVENFIFVKGEDRFGQIDNKRYVAWKQQVKSYGLLEAGAGLFNAHQMGTWYVPLFFIISCYSTALLRKCSFLT